MAWTHGVMAPAYAKINLTLEVLARRADGFHELVSVMHTIELHDTLALWPAPAGTFTLACDDATLAGDENLALRAARLLAEAMDPRPRAASPSSCRKPSPPRPVWAAAAATPRMRSPRCAVSGMPG